MATLAATYEIIRSLAVDGLPPLRTALDALRLAQAAEIMYGIYLVSDNRSTRNAAPPMTDEERRARMAELRKSISGSCVVFAEAPETGVLGATTP